MSRTGYHTVPYTRNTQDKKVQFIKAFANICHQLRLHGDVVRDVVRDGDDEVSHPHPPPRPVCLHFPLDDVPPSLLRLGLRALIYVRSFTPLSTIVLSLHYHSSMTAHVKTISHLFLSWCHEKSIYVWYM